MSQDIVKTGVDRLMSYLEGKERVALTEAANELGVPAETVQSWVDFLVEERLIGIEYKFTKPFIYLNRHETKSGKQEQETRATWDEFHRSFLEKARLKQIPELKAANLWKSHVLSLLEKKREFFYQEARKRKIENIDKVWVEYQTDVLMEI